MTLPANIRVNIGAPFPSLVKGGGLVSIQKANGIWTVSLNFAAVQKSATVPDPANTYVLVWNALTSVFTLMPMGNVSTNKSVRIIATPGPQAAQPADDVIIIKQAVAAPFVLTVDWSQRTKPLMVVDGKGDAGVNNITITPAAGQTQLATVNFSYVIAGNGGNVVLTPLPDGSGAY
jgi:hypothetical protein